MASPAVKWYNARRKMNLNLHLWERKLLLVLADFLLVVGAALVSLAVWSDRMGFTVNPRFFLENPLWLIVILMWLVLFMVFNAYRQNVASDPREWFWSMLRTSGCLLGAYLLAYFILPPVSLPRRPFLWFLFLSGALVTMWRAAYSHLARRGHFLRRVIVVGAGSAGRTIAKVIQAYSSNTHRIVGFIDDDSAKRGSRVLGIPVLGSSGDLVRVVEGHGVSEIVVAITHEIRPFMFEAILACQERGIQCTPMPSLFERLTGQIPVHHVGSNWYIALPLDHAQTQVFYRLFKRAVDISLALAGLAIFSLAFPFIVVLLKLTSKGKIFYAQRRVGSGGRSFDIFKVRTMVENAEPGGVPIPAADNDPRITPLGKILRITALDEFPQLWNVLKGEMSIVGPRPERPESFVEFEKKIPFYRLRLAVRPGTTGWALVNGGYATTVEENLVKLQYDLYYIRNQSVWMDFQILLRTIWIMLTFRRGEKSMRVSVQQFSGISRPDRESSRIATPQPVASL